MISHKNNQKFVFNTNTAGITVLKKELNKTKILNFIDMECPKNSGYPVSEIVTSSIIKNVLNIDTFKETTEELRKMPEFECFADRTTLGRNIRRVGKISGFNIPLSLYGSYFIKNFKIHPNEIRIVVDGTTIEVSPNSKFEGASWVWDNAQGKNVWGYEITIIAITFGDIYLPIHFEFGEMSKESLINRFLVIRMITKANIVLFDGGYACDYFYEELTKNKFEFYTKVPRDWWFNNGLNKQIKDLKEKALFSEKKNFYSTKVFRVKNRNLTNIQYSLCYKKKDKRVLLTNNLEENISEKTFEEFFKRWDIEICNSEIKANFCFEKLPIRDKIGIKGYLLTCFLSLNLMTFIKFKHQKKLGNLFNKGFELLIRWVIKATGRWNSYSKLSKIKFPKNFEFKWFYQNYGLT